MCAEPKSTVAALTEHEFRMGRSCPTKVLHMRAGLPRADEADSFSQWMRDEGGKLRSFALHLFPGAQIVGNGAAIQKALRTVDLIEAGQLVSGAFLTTDQASCHVDFIEADGTDLRLYNVVPKPFDLERHRFGMEFYSQPGRLRREWRDHLELAAYRVWVAQQIFPDRKITPLIVVPVTGAACETEGLHRRILDPSLEAEAHAFETDASQLLRVVSVARECRPFVGTIRMRVEALLAFLNSPTEPNRSYACKQCQFRTGGHRSGYFRCWGPLASEHPSMWDLAFMFFAQEGLGQPVANRLAREGTVSLWDIPEDLLVGKYAARQRMQLRGTLEGREIIQPELRGALAAATYPLRFLDFETIRSILPVHRGGAVNQLTLFQFSVDSRTSENAPLTHAEWLNFEPEHPNRRFLSALRRALGDEGSVAVWTNYEAASLSELLTELISAGVTDEDFDWLRRFLASGRLLDLHQLCFDHYYHPLMKGRTSIKVVLPAVWSVRSPVKLREPYAQFRTDPYAELKSYGSVSDGCAAMQAYLAMQDPAQRQQMAHELLRYCYVDSLAMAAVFDYWIWRTGEDMNAKIAAPMRVVQC